MTALREVDIAKSADPRLGRVAEAFRREGRAPISLHRVIANAPGVLEGFHALSDALRYGTDVADSVRELAILRTAQITNATYEWVHHVVLAERFGVTQSDIDNLDSWAAADFDDATKAALQLADEIAGLGVTAETMANLARHFAPAQIVALVVCISHYHAVARITQALDIEVEPEYRDAFASAGRRDRSGSQSAPSGTLTKATGGNEL
jgi:alkylhydroperoxidase family enzyme